MYRENCERLVQAGAMKHLFPVLMGVLPRGSSGIKSEVEEAVVGLVSNMCLHVCSLQLYTLSDLIGCVVFSYLILRRMIFHAGLYNYLLTQKYLV